MLNNALFAYYKNLDNTFDLIRLLCAKYTKYNSLNLFSNDNRKTYKININYCLVIVFVKLLKINCNIFFTRHIFL